MAVGLVVLAVVVFFLVLFLISAIKIATKRDDCRVAVPGAMSGSPPREWRLNGGFYTPDGGLYTPVLAATCVATYGVPTGKAEPEWREWRLPTRVREREGSGTSGAA
jgi:hypothetical protein